MYLNPSIIMSAQRLIRLILFLLVLTGCGRGSVYHEFVAMPDGKWHQDSILHYQVAVDDSLSPYDFYINIRNNTDYPYSNIYLFFTTAFPNGHITRDTIECILADKDGRWLGSGSGRIKDNKIMLQQALRFPLTGTYHFYLEQGMRQVELQGVEDIGISIETNEP